ncbi:MAG: FkbM family methyltransferase [Thermofilaceae archaeon]
MKISCLLYRLKRMALQGASIKDKAKLCIISVLWALTGIKLPVIATLSLRTANIMTRGTVIRYRGLRYRLIDAHTVHYFLNYFEPWIWQYLESLKQDDVFFDVGAHIGLYSIYVARFKACKVIAIEPHPENYKLLVSNIRLNNLENIIALNIAAWNKNSKLPLFVGDSSATHTLISRRGKGKCIWVKAKRLDDVLRELNVNKVSLVKIDVEGAEMEVLEGLYDTLRHHRSRLIIEVWRNNMDKILSFLKNLNYLVSKIAGSVSRDLLYVYAYPYHVH